MHRALIVSELSADVTDLLATVTRGVNTQHCHRIVISSHMNTLDVCCHAGLYLYLCWIIQTFILIFIITSRAVCLTCLVSGKRLFQRSNHHDNIQRECVPYIVTVSSRRTLFQT